MCNPGMFVKLEQARDVEEPWPGPTSLEPAGAVCHLSHNRRDRQDNRCRKPEMCLRPWTAMALAGRQLVERADWVHKLWH